MDKVIIAYGFEYEAHLYYNCGAIMCRTIENDMPFYANLLIKII